MDAEILTLADAPVVVEVALSGARPGTASNAVPVADEEIVADAVAAWNAGAAVIHLHARELDGSPSVSADRYAPLVEGVRASGCDAILSLACGTSDDVASDAFDCLELRPELVSFDCRGLEGDAAVDRADALRELAVALPGTDTAAQIRCATPSQVAAALQLREEGLLSDPLHFQFALGAKEAPTTIEQALRMRSLMPPDAHWSICAPDAAQLRVNVLCLIAGGHIHTGLADNLWLVEDVPATNRELVERVVRFVDDFERPLATPTEAREILRLRDASTPVVADPRTALADRRDRPQAA